MGDAHLNRLEADTLPIGGEDSYLNVEHPMIEWRPDGSNNAGLWRWPDPMSPEQWPEDATEDMPVEITDQLPLGDFTPGRWGWLLTDVEPLPEPIPATGKQGVWEWTP